MNLKIKKSYKKILTCFCMAFIFAISCFVLTACGEPTPYLNDYKGVIQQSLKIENVENTNIFDLWNKSKIEFSTKTTSSQSNKELTTSGLYLCSIQNGDINTYYSSQTVQMSQEDSSNNEYWYDGTTNYIKENDFVYNSPFNLDYYNILREVIYFQITLSNFALNNFYSQEITKQNNGSNYTLTLTAKTCDFDILYSEYLQDPNFDINQYTVEEFNTNKEMYLSYFDEEQKESMQNSIFEVKLTFDGNNNLTEICYSYETLCLQLPTEFQEQGTGITKEECKLTNYNQQITAPAWTNN